MFSFKKTERLCRNVLIENLYSKGISFNAYPLRITYLFVNELNVNPAQVLFIVSKRRFKKANKRNVLKRRMREAYRVNKPELYNCLNNCNLKLIISFNYVSNEMLLYPEIEEQIIKIIKKLEIIISDKL
jgi:ribonuclease P protein component